MNEPQRRRRALAAAIAEGLESLLVTHLPDVRYLTGFTGSNGAVALSGGRAVLFTDGRYTAQARAEAQRIPVRIVPGSAAVAAVSWIAGQGALRCGFDGQNTSVSTLAALRRALPVPLRRGFFQELSSTVLRLREVKDADEAQRMRNAAMLGCELFSQAVEAMRQPGATESFVAASLELGARRGGAEGMSFETIVTGGVRSSYPHGRATSARLPRRGFVTLDFGVVLEGYCSDMTRTVHMGAATVAEREVYDSVFAAQVAAVAAVRPGVACGEVDEAARSVLRKVRFGRSNLAKFFTHSTGHGVGLEIHEGPRVAAKQEQKLEPGMVVTIEPGVYLPGRFGVRIEDTVLVTDSGCEVLTGRSPKTWMEL